MLFTLKWSLLSDVGHESHECLYAFRSDVPADAASRIAEMPIGLMDLRCVMCWWVPSLPRGAGSSSCWGLSLGVAWAKGLSPSVGVPPVVGRVSAWGPWGETVPCPLRGPLLLFGTCALFILAQWLAA